MPRPTRRVRSGRALLGALLLLSAASCDGMAWPEGEQDPEVLETREGLASFYGKADHGDETASGRTFDMNALVAAHPTYPFDTRVRVVNLENGRQAIVRIVDRGPADEPRRDGVIIDVSRRVARDLGFLEEGRIRVRVEVLEWGDEP